MKQLNVTLIILCGIILLSACGGSVVKKKKLDDRTEMGLKDKVKKMTETPKYGISTFYIFNEAGNFIEKGFITGNPFSKTIVTEKYTYDSENKLDTIIKYSNFSGKLEKKCLYNKDGNITEEQNYTASGNEYILNSTHLYIYDDNGLLVKTQYDRDEENYTECESDKAGNILKQTAYRISKPSMIYREDFEYDNHGNITKHINYNKENLENKENGKGGQIDAMSESKYDSDNRLLEQIQYSYLFNSGKKESEVSQKRSYSYKYDDNGNVTEISCITCNYPIVNKNGKREEQCGDPAITTYTYIYDKHGNWTSREEKRNGRVLSELKRSYSYYGEESPKMTNERLVGVWDYYANPNEKFEIVLKKDGTLIDYYDFHTTGTYKINEDGTILTMVYIYDDGEEHHESKPFNYNIIEFTGDRLVIANQDGSQIFYDRKSKSDNYDGEL